ncbi:MAG: prolyl oligopeptidase family serine peptidase, partial [Hyphomicrobiaceae bacterium]
MTTALDRRQLLAGAGAAGAGLFIAMPGAAPARSLIPRTKLFGVAERSNGHISPDGSRLAWFGRDKKGGIGFYVAPIGNLDDVRSFQPIGNGNIHLRRWWAYDARHLLYMQDTHGDENWHFYAVDLAADTVRDLTPIAGVQAELQYLSRDRPGIVALRLNDRDARWHDLWRVEIATGERELVLKNTEEYAGFALDWHLEPRLASKALPDGAQHLLRWDGRRFEPFLRVPPEDGRTTHIGDFTRAGDAWHLWSSVGRNTSALFKVDWATGKQTLLAEHPETDAGDVLTDPETGEATAIGFDYLKREWRPLTEQAARDFTFLSSRLTGTIGVAGQTDDGKRWIVTADAAEQPGTYYLYDRSRLELTELFYTRPELKTYRLAPMHPVVFRARDGLDLVSYLTLPAAERGSRPRAPLPMVLNVHGGPADRDSYGYNREHQWLADRGYAVLSVNFRGSSGFGKAFQNAGDREWGRKMQNDMLDAVDRAVEDGIVDRDRVAIMGASYGGYAVLAALAFTPEVFRCGIDIVGPSDLETFIAGIPPYWTSVYELLARRVGDPRTDEGRALLRERSPVHKAGAITKPLLIAHGMSDPRVKLEESDRIVAAMGSNGLPVTYVLYPYEGHGLAGAKNRLAFYAIVEAF